MERNRIKRLLRESFRARASELPPDHDFVVVARPDIAGLLERDGGRGIAAALEQLVAEAGLAEGNL